MKIIGVTGLNGSGKDEVVNYLHDKYSIPVISVGDIVRNISKNERLEPNRDNLHYVSRKYFARFGKNYFINIIINRIESEQWNICVINGVRTPVDVETLTNKYGDDFILLHVRVADPQIRFNRLQNRKEIRDPNDYEDFLQQDKDEESLFNIRKTIALADIVLKNEGGIAQLHNQVDDKIIEKVLFDKLPVQQD